MHLQHHTINLRYIFHPKLSIKYSKDYQSVEKFTLEGFHHDHNSALEKSGAFTFTSKIYGDAACGASECFIGVSDWGNGMVHKEIKTYFPSHWTKQEVAEVIFTANQNRIKFVRYAGLSEIFECKGPNSLLIDIIVDINNTIISAYPSHQNFLGLK